MKQEIKLEEYIPPGCNLVVAWTLNPTQGSSLFLNRLDFLSLALLGCYLENGHWIFDLRSYRLIGLIEAYILDNIKNMTLKNIFLGRATVKASHNIYIFQELNACSMIYTQSTYYFDIYYYEIQQNYTNSLVRSALQHFCH